MAEPSDRRIRGNLPGGLVPCQRIRPLRHDRQCLGVDHRLVYTAPGPWQDVPLLHSEQPEGRADGGQLRPTPAAHQDPAQGDQRRLASLRTQLLPSISTSGAVPRADRYVDVSPGIQVHPPAFAAAERSMTFTSAPSDGKDPRSVHTQRVPGTAPGSHAAGCGGGGSDRVPRRSALDRFKWVRPSFAKRTCEIPDDGGPLAARAGIRTILT